MSEKKSGRLEFPPDFRWSVATSAHQIEGMNDHSDWWDFEQKAGAIKHGERSGRACDHWNRVEEDVALIRSLNLRHARLSVEWARIEPRQGDFDRAALAHYRRELEILRGAGIAAMVTLNHFTLPKWVAALGGWTWRGVAPAFARYAEAVYTALGDLATDWVTINEPMVLLVAGYVSGDFPPAERDIRRVGAPLIGLVRGHAAAYHALHAAAKNAGRAIRVGLAHHLRVFDPARSWHLIDRVAAGVAADSFNWALPDALRTGTLDFRLPLIVRCREAIPEARGTEDFFGLNYYGRDLIRFAPRQPLRFLREDRRNAWRNDLGWEIYPRGLYRILKEIAARYPTLPITITENGLADASDLSRSRFIREHLQELHRAIGDGVKVEGYAHWSLLDNFEWAEGFSPRFGLFAVDYASMARTPRGSADVYGKIALENAVEFPGAT